MHRAYHVDQDRRVTDTHNGAVRGEGDGGVDAVSGILETATKLPLHFLDLPAMETAVADDKVFLEKFVV